MDIEKACTLLSQFFETGKKLEFQRRQAIISYGEPTDSIYWISTGAVKVFGYSDDGDEIIHYLYRPNELFPIVKLVGLFEPNEIGYSAFTKTEVHVQPYKALKAFLDANPYALWVLLQQQAEANDRIICLTTSPAELRVGRRALTLAKRFGKPVGDHLVIDLPFTIQEFAESIRLSRETTGKAIRMFEGKGAIIMGRQSILIYPEILKDVCAHIPARQPRTIEA